MRQLLCILCVHGFINDLLMLYNSKVWAYANNEFLRCRIIQILYPEQPDDCDTDDDFDENEMTPLLTTSIPDNMSNCSTPPPSSRFHDDCDTPPPNYDANDNNDNKNDNDINITTNTNNTSIDNIDDNNNDNDNGNTNT